MKKVAILLALFCMLTVTASAAYIPEDVISENRDGRQLIVKTYMLPPDADPSGLVEEPFEVEGYSYHHLETVKEEQTFEDSKIQTEVVTLETDVDDLAAILEQLDASMEYNKDGYSGVLTLDHTTIQTEAAGYTTKYYTITDGKRCGFSKRYFLVLVACRHLTCTKTECRKMFLSLIAPLTTIRLNRGKRSNRLPYIFAQGQER